MSGDIIIRFIFVFQKLRDLAGCILECGDYRLQNTLFEILFRLSPTVESSKQKYLSGLFSKAPALLQRQLQNSFMSISAKSFESGCRTFLNLLNGKVLTRYKRIHFISLLFFL